MAIMTAQQQRDRLAAIIEEYPLPKIVETDEGVGPWERGSEKGIHHNKVVSVDEMPEPLKFSVTAPDKDPLHYINILEDIHDIMENRLEDMRHAGDPAWADGLGWSWHIWIKPADAGGMSGKVKVDITLGWTFKWPV